MSNPFRERTTKKKKGGGKGQPPEQDGFVPASGGDPDYGDDDRYGGGGDGRDDGGAYGHDEPQGCAVQALGHRNGTYYFLTPSGEFRALSDRGMTVNGLTSLFDGNIAWLCDHFESHARGRDDGFNNQAAAAFLIRACVKQGLFNADIPMRGPGVWRDGRGELIVHAGDALLIKGDWQPSGQRIDDTLYPAWPPIARPSLRAASVKDGQRLLQIFNLWAYKTQRGADLVVGWIGAAMLGGAPDWRSHMYANGAQGMGKTWLATGVAAALGAGAHEMDNNTSEAGLRQWLTGEARAIILDESEHDETKGRVQEVIELLRSISSGKGSRSTRGSSGHRAVKFSVTGCAFLSSVLHAPLKPQDRSRFMLVELDKLPPMPKEQAAMQADKVKAAIDEAAALSPGLRARAIERWPFFLECFRIYRAAFLAQDCTPRAADQIATILAGRDLLCADVEPSHDVIENTVFEFGDLIKAAAENEDEGEGQECLLKFYSSPADLWRSGERWTIGEVIEKAMKHERDHTNATFRSQLKRLGMRLDVAKDGTNDPVLLVANKHEALSRIFKDSRWSQGVWSQALRMLDGAYAWSDPMRFTGPRQRCTAIPKRWLPVSDAVEQEAEQLNEQQADDAAAAAKQKGTKGEDMPPP